MTIDNNKGGEYGKFFVQELQSPPGMLSPEFQKVYDKFAQRILWMDGNVCPGAFQMNTAWYFNVPEKDPIFEEHSHAGTNELVGFFGSNKDDMYDLGGVIEFSINGEAHRLTRSTMIYIPAGFSHNPMRILEVNRPIFHFSVVTASEYDAMQIYK